MSLPSSVLAAASLGLLRFTTGCAPALPATSESERAPPAARPAHDPRIGHYTVTTDTGPVGMVIDRSLAKTKIRIDGTRETVELVPVPRAPVRGDAEGMWLHGPEGLPWLFASTAGELWYMDSFERRQAWRAPVTSLHRVLRDGDAAPLGRADHIGQTQTPIQDYIAALAAVSIRVNLPEYTSADSTHLGRVGEALARVEPAAYVSASGRLGERFIWTPALFPVGQYLQLRDSAEPWRPAASGLGRYGARLWPLFFGSSGGIIELEALQTSLGGIAVHTPGVVWEATGDPLRGHVVFVTLDGGRYQLDFWDSELARGGAPLRQGLSPESDWPPPLAKQLVTPAAAGHLARAGAVPESAWKDLSRLEAAYLACASRSWAGKRAASEDAATTTPEIETAREADIARVAAKDCAAAAAAAEAALAALIDARGASRKALHAKARDRALASGAVPR